MLFAALYIVATDCFVSCSVLSGLTIVDDVSTDVSDAVTAEAA